MVCILSKLTKMWFVKGLQTVTLSTLMTLLLVHCRSKADFLFFYNIQIQKMGNNSITTTLLPYFFVCMQTQLFFFPCNNSQIMLNWHNELYSKSVGRLFDSVFIISISWYKYLLNVSLQGLSCSNLYLVN